MYMNNHTMNISYSGNISNYVIEKISRFKNKVQSFFKTKNTPEVDLIEYFNSFSDLLFSVEPLRMEFTAFSNLRIIIEYIVDNNCIEEHKEFLKNNIDLFFDLLESKIDLIKNNDSDHQMEYEKQLELYDSKILEYNSYFYKHIYEGSGEDTQDAIAIGKILLDY